MRNTRRAGQVRQFDAQADIYQARYELVRALGNGSWVCKELAPDDAEIARIYAYEGILAGADLVSARVARAGREFTVKFVSSARYHDAF